MASEIGIVPDVCMPTFLQDIFRNRENVSIIHNTKNSCMDESVSFIGSQSRADWTIKDELESFDGCPLEINLNTTDTDVCYNEKEQKFIWLTTEAKYFPISLNLARTVLQGLKDTGTMACICDGTDKQGILTLGASNSNGQQITNFQVKFFGCHSLIDSSVSFSALHKRHMRYATDNVESEVTINKLYRIFGHYKRCSEDVKQVGQLENNAFLEATFKEMNELSHPCEVNLYLQANMSNSNSPFYPLWQQLQLLNKFIDNFKHSDELENFIISSSEAEFDKVYDSILEIANKGGYIPHAGTFSWANCDTLNMRSELFTDRLWTQLMAIQKLSDVRTMLLLVFQYINEENIQFRLPLPNELLIGQIINGLMTKNIVMPTINESLTLKFLIELGLTKLQNDYMFLIKKIDENLEAYFCDEWLQLREASKSIGFNSRMSRMSRLTSVADTESIADFRKQLNFISRLHLCLEFMYLARNCEFGQMEIGQINEQIRSSQENTFTFDQLLEKRVVDMQCTIYNSQPDISSSWPLISMNVMFKNSPTLTTIFHFSKDSIYPQTISKDYVAEEDKYFVYEAMMHTW